MEKTFSVKSYLIELESLVNIDSGSRNVEGIRKIVDFFKNKYEGINYYVEEHVFNEEAGPCLEIRNKKDENIDLLIIGHMDTVFPVGTASERPFSIKDDRAYGPGVADMKSGLLSTYYIMELLDKDIKENLNICIAMNSDEEISSQFSKDWLVSLAKKSKYAFIMEPGRANGAMVIERKGLAKYIIDFKGVAAHAGVEPEKGISTIHELGNWIMELIKLNNYEIGTSLNFGVVKGGTAANVVADKATAEIDVRYKIDEELDKVEKKIKDLLNSPLKEGIEVSVVKKGHRPPMNPNEKVEKICRSIEDIAKELNIEIKWEATGGGSDANFTSAVGVPSIDAMGPIGGAAHGVNEYLVISSIEERIRLAIEIIKRIINK